MLTPVRIGGGVAGEMQFTPDRCSAVFAVVGLLPGMTQESVLADIDAVVQSFARTRPGLAATLRPFPDALFVTGTRELPAVPAGQGDRRRLPTGSGLRAAHLSQECVQRHHPFPGAWNPAVTFGPGEDGWPPINEYIRIGKAVAATKILALALVDILGVAE